MIRAAIDADCWKSFTIADAITFFKAAMDELKPETVNACWKNLWNKPSMISKASEGSTEK